MEPQEWHRQVWDLLQMLWRGKISSQEYEKRLEDFLESAERKKGGHEECSDESRLSHHGQHKQEQ